MRYLVGEQEVKSLLVRCPTACEWNGELRSLKDHIRKVCENTLVPCPNGCRKSNTITMRRHLNSHLTLCKCIKCQKITKFRNAKHHAIVCPKRQYTCLHCNEAGVYDERTTTHLEVCPKVKVSCLKCSGQFFRCEKSVHVTVCPNEPVRCKYYSIGCEEKPPRKCLSMHEKNAQLHLSLATEEVLRLKNMKNTLKFRMKYFEVHKFERKYFYSPSFFTSASGYKLCVRVYANGYGNDSGRDTHVSVYACLMKGDNDDSLSWPFTGTVTFELLNQLEDKNHHKMTITFTVNSVVSQRVVDREKGPGWGYPEFISYADLAHKPLTNTQYLKDDTLIFRVSAEAPDYKPWLD